MQKSENGATGTTRGRGGPFHAQMRFRNMPRVPVRIYILNIIDTPGHAAFSAMRARGAQITDIVVLIISADDRVMPQTKEAIEHAQSAKVPIIVAVNKIDKENADPDKVIGDLSQHNIVPEEWGGDTICVKISAHTGQGVDDLLEAISLQAEILELKASPTGPAIGLSLIHI